MNKIIAIFLMLISLNVYSNTNMQPIQMAYYAEIKYRNDVSSEPINDHKKKLMYPHAQLRAKKLDS